MIGSSQGIQIPYTLWAINRGRIGMVNASNSYRSNMKPAKRE
jgi:hypothetical protein